MTEKSKSKIFFDEVDTADSRLGKAFLRLLEEGKITTGTGKTTAILDKESGGKVTTIKCSELSGLGGGFLLLGQPVGYVGFDPAGIEAAQASKKKRSGPQPS